MHDYWHKEEDEMIAYKRTLIWTWTCLVAAIFLLFAVSCSGDGGGDLAIYVGGGTLCIDTPRFALCTSARCEIDPSDSKYAICYCDVESGANWGKTTCEERMPQDAELRSNFSPIQAGPPSHLKALVCENEPMWASCLDALCTVDPNDPTKAECKCPVATSKPWETLGGGCDPVECNQLWSAGHMVDKEFQEVLDAFGRLGAPGANYPYCSSE